MSVIAEIRGSFHQDCLSLAEKSKPLERECARRRITQFYLKAVRETATVLLEGKLSKIDPIVGENTCQARAHAVIMSRDFLDLDMDYLVKSYILTCGKFFDVKEDGSEVSGINLKRVQEHLSPESSIGLVQSIICKAKTSLARDTIRRIQSLRELLPKLEQECLEDKHIKTVCLNKKKKLHLEVSCAFYNMKAIVLDLFRKKVPIVIVEHSPKKEADPLRLVYIEGKLSFEPLEDDRAVFVIEGFILKECNHKKLGEQIQEIGLVKVILCNIAQVPQYSQDDDISTLPKKAQAEILKYREMGLDIVKVFHIVHTHAATLGELRRGE